MSHDAPDKSAESNGHAGVIVAAVLVILLLYVFAVGPIMRYYDQMPPQLRQAIEILYKPLAWVDDALLSNWILKYASMWERER